MALPIKKRLIKTASGCIQVIHPLVLENNFGQYKVWVEKVPCLNHYYFIARQISVKYGDKHFPIENYSWSYKMFSFNEEKLSLEVNEIPLNNWHKNWIGPIYHLRREISQWLTYISDQVDRMVTRIPRRVENDIKKRT